MSTYTQWQIHTYRDGDTTLEHIVCHEEYNLPGTQLIADLIHQADTHTCTGAPPP